MSFAKKLLLFLKVLGFSWKWDWHHNHQPPAPALFFACLRIGQVTGVESCSQGKPGVFLNAVLPGLDEALDALWGIASRYFQNWNAQMLKRSKTAKFEDIKHHQTMTYSQMHFWKYTENQKWVQLWKPNICCENIEFADRTGGATGRETCGKHGAKLQCFQGDFVEIFQKFWKTPGFPRRDFFFFFDIRKFFETSLLIFMKKNSCFHGQERRSSKKSLCSLGT